MKRKLLLGVLAAAALAAPGTAHAWTPYSGCASAGAGFQTCASFEVQVTPVGNRTQVYIRVRNDGIFTNGIPEATHGSTLTRFGVLAPDLQDLAYTNIGTFGSPNTVFADGATQSGNPASRWTPGAPNLPSLGPVEWALGTDVPNPNRGGINSCIAPSGDQTPPGPGGTPQYFRTCGADQWVVFAFNTSNALSADQFQLAWHVMSSSHDGESYGGTTTPPGQVAPEPMSMALLGTGLAGLYAARRRRRRDDVIGEADDSEDDR